MPLRDTLFMLKFVLACGAKVCTLYVQAVPPFFKKTISHLKLAPQGLLLVRESSPCSLHHPEARSANPRAARGAQSIAARVEKSRDREETPCYKTFFIRMIIPFPGQVCSILKLSKFFVFAVSFLFGSFVTRRGGTPGRYWLFVHRGDAESPRDWQTGLSAGK